MEDLLGRMTAEEKARMLAGSGWMESYPNERLGIPAIKMADGPMGVRNWAGSSAITNAAATAPVNATAFPAGIGDGVDLGRRPRAGRGPRHRAAGEGPGTRHDPGAHGEHQSHAAVGPELRGLRRGSLPRRAHGRRLHPGRAGRGRHPFRQALRGQQPGVRAPPHRREDRPAHAPRDLLPGLQGGRGGGRASGR